MDESNGTCKRRHLKVTVPGRFIPAGKTAARVKYPAALQRCKFDCDNKMNERRKDMRLPGESEERNARLSMKYMMMGVSLSILLILGGVVYANKQEE